MGEATQAAGKSDTGAMYKTLGKLKADQQQFAGAMILEGEHKGEAAQALVAEKAGHFFVIGKDGKATEIKDENIKDLDTAKAAVRQAISSGKFPSTLPLDAEKFLKAGSSNDGADPKAGTGGTGNTVAEKKAATVAAQKAQLVALYNQTIANPKQVVELGAGDKKSKIAIAKIGDTNVVIDAQGRATGLDAASKDAASLTPAIKQALEKAVNAGQFGGEAVAAAPTTPASDANGSSNMPDPRAETYSAFAKDTANYEQIPVKDADGKDAVIFKHKTTDAAKPFEVVDFNGKTVPFTTNEEIQAAITAKTLIPAPTSPAANSPVTQPDTQTPTASPVPAAPDRTTIGSSAGAEQKNSTEV